MRIDLLTDSDVRESQVRDFVKSIRLSWATVARKGRGEKAVARMERLRNAGLPKHRPPAFRKGSMRATFLDHGRACLVRHLHGGVRIGLPECTLRVRRAAQL